MMVSDLKIAYISTNSLSGLSFAFIAFANKPTIVEYNLLRVEFSF